VHATIATAAAVPGAKQLPPHLANSPALRPHLRKAATVDPK
jgi:penicillin-insensitive murein endopeptidase